MAPGITFKNPFTGSTHQTGRGASEEEAETAAGNVSSSSSPPSRRRSALTGDKSTRPTSGRVSPRSGRGDKSPESEARREDEDVAAEDSQRNSFPWYEKGESSRMEAERVQKERARAGLPPIVFSDEEGGPSSARAAALTPPPPPPPQQQQGSPRGRRRTSRLRSSQGTLEGSDEGGELSGATTLAGSFNDQGSVLEVGGKGKKKWNYGEGQQEKKQGQDETRTKGAEEAEDRPASLSPPPPSHTKRCMLKSALERVGRALLCKKNKGKGSALGCCLRQKKSWEVVKNKVKFPEAWWRAGWLKK
ncbi:hypothetical protein CGMCC3_g10604 [Colletotrichum fructicola]|uniref:Uncharacterized protein n=1 Tax=Colletotrichum fructicola (strain Nara gc5) TaxID=1213859 RepID=A0A7J6JQJ2_COLFN|nr:uncharacterized protein CGMCC3_g10604 [Colletotrichum fructicola]KAE9573264.1 hypothetical protein CGMCC3_g10604 [Colletotrichum fructicola]KAF4423555.1 hypothetical protein CFRS1_v004514 [Colletotrichum fructicola]KAF4492002.1 hypothetical protein CGGC5_v000920 [Colletotrichum fructicola Nara gc5]KAF4888839.1 hypothetical protein CGCFRS4_v009629 [Colletotrichum fructicola]